MQAGDFMPFVSVDWTLVFMLLNTLILFLALKKFLFVPVKKVLDDRASAVENELKAAEVSNNEALELKKQYEESLQGAKVEASDIVAAAKKRANEQAEEIINEAKSASQELSKRAAKEIELEKVKAMNEVKSEIGLIAVELASKVVEKDITESDHQNLIDSFIKDIGE